MSAIKRLVLIGVFLSIPFTAKAADVWLSSRTATTDSMKTLCGGGKRGILHGVCNNTNAGSSSMTVVNSSYTLTGVQTFGNRGTAVASGCFYYDVVAPNGLLYDKFGTADVVILYQCY